MNRADLNQRVTAKQVTSAFVALAVLFGPPFALVVSPGNSVVAMLFGGYRLLAFYVVAIGVFAWFEWPAIRHAFGNSLNPREGQDKER
jgi:hypothetical protein